MPTSMNNISVHRLRPQQVHQARLHPQWRTKDKRLHPANRQLWFQPTSLRHPAVHPAQNPSKLRRNNMAQKPALLITGVSGNLGLRVLEFLPEFDVIGVDIVAPATPSKLAVFEKVDLAEERSCHQLLELLRKYRPEGVAHLAFINNPVDRQRMWHINVSGTGRVLEAVAEHNRMLGGVHKFVVRSSALAYGPNLAKPVSEDAPLQAHILPYALDAREADLAVQARAKGLKSKTYILRPPVLAGPNTQSYLVDILRGVPTGAGKLAERLRRRNSRLP